MTTYIIYKAVKDSNGKRSNLYLSVTGKWIKSTGNATAKSHDEAKKIADDMGCAFRSVSYRS